jgi:hypothetical protein
MSPCSLAVTGLLPCRRCCPAQSATWCCPTLNPTAVRRAADACWSSRGVWRWPGACAHNRSCRASSRQPMWLFNARTSKDGVVRRGVISAAPSDEIDLAAVYRPVPTVRFTAQRVCLRLPCASAKTELLATRFSRRAPLWRNRRHGRFAGAPGLLWRRVPRSPSRAPSYSPMAPSPSARLLRCALRHSLRRLRVWQRPGRLPVL